MKDDKSAEDLFSVITSEDPNKETVVSDAFKDAINRHTLIVLSTAAGQQVQVMHDMGEIIFQTTKAITTQLEKCNSMDELASCIKKLKKATK